MEYFYTYVTHVKGRWRDRQLIDVLCDEFAARDIDYYKEAIALGVITVNDKIVHETHKLKDSDIIRHLVHSHEPDQPTIEVLADEQDYVVVNKPAGIPCHPVGAYHLYTVTKTLFGDRKVGCINRLDMPVSGVLILTLNNRQGFHDLLEKATKIYIAKVRGNFPEYVEVDQPIGVIKGRIHGIFSGGKLSRTIFKKLEYKNGHSLVQCQPITGRTHQIRIHLRHLGFPVLNDILYGEGQEPLSESLFNCNASISEFVDLDKYRFVVDHCKAESNRTFLIKDSFICLHAWKYTFNNKTYEAPWPEWASL